MSNHHDFSYLLHGYIAGTLSEQEKKQLLQALNDPENVNRLSAIVAGVCNQAHTEGFIYDKEKVERMIRGIVAGTREEQATGAAAGEDNHYAPGKTNKIRSSGAPWLRYAAAVLFLGALFYYNHTKNAPQQPVTQAWPNNEIENDILPGSNKAVLTLSNGKTVELDENGMQVITDGEVAIQNNNGSLAYSQADVVAYNTMATPRGGQYKLRLPDGTWVWLNAASSITYPTAFPGKTRVVSISGEAYFEVAKNPAKPFTVKTYKDEITVKGTSFNVNSYTDEPGIKTSLVEGLVEINHTLLKPGHAYTGGKVIAADLEKELAWKNAVFNFHHVKLEDAMRQIARWYDVEVRYEGNVKDIELGGEIGRNLTLQQLLNGLQDKDTHFRLEGKVLTVY
ncbi:MAG: FecR family protein [Chitinophagaceae bacterium]|nr:FecR family protein [Chitinophagaceae bacterium]